MCSISDNIDEYCRTHPTSVLPHPNNCAQYFNCRDRNSKFGHYLEECTYPQLFSSLTKTCANFTTARCEKRFVPQAPCKLFLTVFFTNSNVDSMSLKKKFSPNCLTCTCLNIEHNCCPKIYIYYLH